MESIFENLCNAYRSAYQTKGAFSPLATEIRQIIVRHWQQTGQTAILDMNREMGVTVKSPNAPDESGLKTFVHPSAQQPKKEPAAATPGIPAAQTATPGKPSPQPKGDQQPQQPQRPPLPANPAKDIPGNKVVAAGDPVEPAVGDQPVTNPPVKMTAEQLVAVKDMAPGEIVAMYGVQWIKEKLTAHKLEFNPADKDTKLAAILKNKARK